MVVKVGKYRVRSGNTLKASNSRYVKNYLKHSCIVKRILQSDSENEKKLSDPFDEFNVDTEGVVYSLNKKGRWTLPQLMEREILSGNLHKENKISLTEFHKLKKRANCINFCSNKGRRKHVYPKRKTYFNKASVLKSMEFKKTSRLHKNKSRGHSRRPTPQDVDRIENEIKAPEPEIQYEVFHPSPITSSVTHNPKYIKSLSCKNESDSVEPKVEFKKKRHRQKLQLVDYLKLVEDSCIEDIEEDTMIDILDALSDINDESPISRDYPNKLSEHNIIGQLLDRALQAQTTCVAFLSNKNEKGSTRSKSGNKSVFSAYDLFDNRQKDTEETKSFEENTKEHKKSSDTGSQIHLDQRQQAQPVPTRLIIPSICVSPEYLHSEFSQKYIEAATFPRKFVLDITSYSRERLKRCRKFSSCYLPAIDLNSYLSFTYDGLYDTGLDIYNIALHMNLNKSSVEINTLCHLQDYTVDDIIERVCDYISTLYPHVFFETEEKEAIFHARNKPYKCFDDLAHLNKWDTKIHSPAATERQVFNSLSSCLSNSDGFHDDNRPEFCNICFECIDTTLSNSVAATALSSCCHWFCDICWKEHLSTQIKRGSTKLTCPEYECNENVDLATLISLVSLNVIRLFVHIHDVSQFKVDSEYVTKWCPNQFCGRMIKVKKSGVIQNRPINVECECGNEFCFTCLNLSHWPASCSNTSEYRKIMKRNGDDSIIPFDDVPTIFVRGKNCPKCGRFIEKHGGCNSMSCVCGHSFCWSCLKDFGSHNWPSPRCAVPDSARTTKIAIRHETTVFGSTSTTFYQKAIECRQLRHPTKLRRLRKSAKQLGLRLKEKCLKRGSSFQDYLTDFQPEGVHFQRGADKIPVFIDKMTCLAIELFHVLEHFAVVIDQSNDSKKKRKLGQLFFRFQDLVLNIRDLLLASDPCIQRVIPRLLTLQQYSTLLLKVLVNTAC